MKLYEPQHWEWAQVHVEFSEELPAEPLVQSIHLVPFLNGSPDYVVLCRGEHGPWFLPGGTREPDEGIYQCLERELFEEAGAIIIGPVQWIGCHLAKGYLYRPYRPHLPHPYKAWLWGAARVEIRATPTNPTHPGEMLEVHAWPFAQATEIMKETEGWYPELLLLASQALKREV